MPEAPGRSFERLSHRPAVIGAAGFAAGCVAARWLAPGPYVLIALALFLGLLAMAFAAKNSTGPALVASALVFALLGLWAGGRTLHPLVHFKDHILAHLNKRVVIQGKVTSDPREWSRGEKFALRVESVDAGSGFVPARGGILLYLTGERDLGPGDRIEAGVRLKPFFSLRNPGGFDYPLYMASQGLYATAFLAGSSPHLNIRKSASPIIRARSIFRSRFSALLAKLERKREAELLRALIVGERAGVGEGLLEEFNATGTRHLLAISGLHLGIVASLAFGVGLLLFSRLLPLSLRYGARKPAAVLALVAASFYAWLTPLYIPTSRALIMLALLVAAALLDRLRDTASVLALAALVLLAFFPASIFTASFQLSFVAVAGIGLYVHSRREKKRRNLLVDGALVSLAASVATFPLVLHHFHLVAPASFLLNVVLVPLVGFVVVPLGLASLVLAPVSLAAAKPVATLATLALGAGVDAVHLFAKSPLAGLNLPPPGPLWVALCYAALLAVVLPQSKRGRIAGLVALVLVILAPIVSRAVVYKPSEELQVTVLDVGAGASTVVRLPGEKVIVVDAGPRRPRFDSGARIVAPALRSMGVTRIDHLVLSQAWPGLAGGLAALVREFKTGEFWYRGSPAHLPGELARALKERTVPTVGPRELAVSGAKVVPAAGGAEGSIALLVSFKNIRLLIAQGGLDERSAGKMDVLVAPSVAYTSKEKLKALSPRIVVYGFREEKSRVAALVAGAGLSSTIPLTAQDDGAITLRVEPARGLTAEACAPHLWRPQNP